MNEAREKYETSLLKVNKLLNDLENAGLDVTEYKDEKDQIVDECLKDAEDISNYHFENLKDSSYKFIYSNAEGKLDKLYKKLKKYISSKMNKLYTLNLNLENCDDQVCQNEDAIVHTNQKDLLKNAAKSIAIVAVNLGVSVGLIIGSVFLSKKIATTEKYPAKITEYNLQSSECNVLDGYVTTDKDQIFLVDYGSFKRNSKMGTFERLITTYDLSNLEKLGYSDYLNLNLEVLNIKGRTEIDYQDLVSVEDLYNETIRVLKEIEVTSNKSVDVVDNSKMLLCLIGIMTLLIAIDVIIEKLIKSKSYYEGIYIFNSIYAATNDVDEVIRYKKIKEQIERLSKKIIELIQNNKSLIDRMESLIPFMEINPEYPKENVMEIKNILKRIRSLESAYMKK